MNKQLPVIVLILVALTTGCRSVPDRTPVIVEPETEDDIVPAAHTDLVSMNLIYALAQLTEVQPRQTTVQILPAATQLGRAIGNHLDQAGYGLQRVGSDIGSNFVRYQYQNTITESGPITRYSLSIGFVRAERNYVRKNGAIFPDSEMLITGASEALIKNNDSIFANQNEFHQFSSDTLFDSNSGPEPIQLSADGEPMPAEKLKFSASVKRNIHDNDEQSNYLQVFEDYEDVRNVVLIFPNDKLNVGQNNKKVLRDIAVDYNPDTDIFSVIGCSHGATKIEGGNVALATGRANRVKEELIIAQIPYEQIFEEGCWGNVYHEAFPSRGVVVILKRRIS